MLPGTVNYGTLHKSFISQIVLYEGKFWPWAKFLYFVIFQIWMSASWWRLDAVSCVSMDLEITRVPVHRVTYLMLTAKHANWTAVSFTLTCCINVILLGFLLVISEYSNTSVCHQNSSPVATVISFSELSNQVICRKCWFFYSLDVNFTRVVTTTAATTHWTRWQILIVLLSACFRCNRSLWWFGCWTDHQFQFIQHLSLFWWILRHF